MTRQKGLSNMTKKNLRDQDWQGISLRGMISWSLRGHWTTWYPWLVILIQMVLILLLLSKMNTDSHMYHVDEETIELEQRLLDLRFDARILKELPVNAHIQSDKVFYNRVPKCGSSSLIDLIIQMADLNNFTFARSSIYMTFYMEPEFQNHLTQRFIATKPPLLYERHLHFMDFTKFSGEQPVYINLIREPMDRLVSWYYFRRFQWGHIRDMAINKRWRSYDACVLGNYSECVDPMGDDPEEGYFKIIPFFCGQEPFCREPSDKALIQAVQNVKKYYAVVGVLEELPQFVEALEYVIPTFFKGASQAYAAMENELMTKHKTTYKLPVSAVVQRMMYPKLKYEYQFYIFIRSRFHKLSSAIRDAKEKYSGKTA